MLRESAAIVVVAGCLAVTLGILRGVPEVAARDDSAVCASPDPARPAIRWISQEQARDLVGDATVSFVDARDESEYEAGHVTGSVHVPFATGSVPAEAIEMLRPARTVIAYCDTSNGCARSTHLAGLLVLEGLQDVRVLEGGVQAWIEHGYPAEAGECLRCP